MKNNKMRTEAHHHRMNNPLGCRFFLPTQLPFEQRPHIKEKKEETNFDKILSERMYTRGSAKNQTQNKMIFPRKNFNCANMLIQTISLLFVILPSLVTSQAVNSTEDSIVSTPATQAPTQTSAPPDDVPVYLTDEAITEGDSWCVTNPIPFDPYRYKSHYHIAVQATRGDEAAIQAYNKTFVEYLTATAGKRFDPPITFEMIPVTFEGMFTAIDNEEVDFFYATPSVYSCIGIEVGASPVATITSRLEVRGHTYDLDVYGGVIATRSENDAINTITDLKDKVIGAGGISYLMAAQTQFHEMQKAGMSYVDDPKQVVFTGDEFDVVEGVLSGEFDVGFVRTDTIERTKNAEGDYVDPDLFKIIEPKIYVLDDGELFPFLHSMPIYPEWLVAALTSVPDVVAEEVQDALLQLESHALVGQLYEDCLIENGRDVCDLMSFPKDFDPDARCDSTKPRAALALAASKIGQYAGFRTSRSYFALRSMQQDAGFLKQDDKGDWKCTRASNVYDGLTCPDGHYKRSREQFEKSCEQVGLPCKEGYDCFCRPCVKAFEVDIYEYGEGDQDFHLVDYFGSELGGCEKMSVCGTVEQTRSITFRAFDNTQRENAEVTVLLHSGEKPIWLPVTQVPNTFAYEFTISEKLIGIEVFEVYVNGKQISQSPLRVEIVELDCDLVHGISSNRVSDFDGNCVCSSDTYEIGGRCMTSSIFLVLVFIGVFILLLCLLSFYMKYKRKQSDSVWHVNVDELVFDETPKIIGQGGFGVVILGEYRGTKVAVKRVLPSPASQKSNNNGEGTVDDSRGSSRGSVKLVSFDDVEAPKEKSTVKRHTSRHNSGSISGSHSIDHILPMEQNANSILRILGSAMVSSHGRGDIFGQGEMPSQKNSWMPFWLRLDQHSQQKREFVAEMRLLSRLRHPCITTVMGAVVSPVVDPMLVMEYMEYGSLYDILHNKTMYTGGEIILQIVRDVAQGIRFLHESRPPILHGDLKAKNILVDTRFRAKVADFGLAHLNATKGVLQGTPLFMAPEYLRRRSEYNTTCDMYSLGMIFYEIYARRDPFEGEDPEKLLPKICHPRINLRPPVPETCPHKMTDIMKKLWSANPFFRPAAKDLDFVLMDINAAEAEPLEKKNPVYVDSNRANKTAKELLYDVFPKHIADALNAGQRVEPESHDLVTVFFSDIIGFADIAATFSPLKISAMLDRLYQAFDTLSKKRKIFKVETIGDSWMGVCNLNDSQADTHVKCIAEFAIDAVEAASKIPMDDEEPERGCIEIRVGFHSGPVVTNVIGTLNPRYGLFGDTVNTASRMESSSMPGKILCSESSALLLAEQAPDIDLRKRGKIQVKGKGAMTTYWVGTKQVSPTDVPAPGKKKEAAKKV